MAAARWPRDWTGYLHDWSCLMHAPAGGPPKVLPDNIRARRQKSGENGGITNTGGLLVHICSSGLAGHFGRTSARVVSARCRHGIRLATCRDYDVGADKTLLPAHLEVQLHSMVVVPICSSSTVAIHAPARHRWNKIGHGRATTAGVARDPTAYAAASMGDIAVTNLDNVDVLVVNPRTATHEPDTVFCSFTVITPGPIRISRGRSPELPCGNGVNAVRSLRPVTPCRLHPRSARTGR